MLQKDTNHSLPITNKTNTFEPQIIIYSACQKTQLKNYRDLTRQSPYCRRKPIEYRNIAVINL